MKKTSTFKPTALTPKIIAGNIRKIREFRNYTQDYLAAKMSISQNAYSKIELGYNRIMLDRLLQIAVVLEVEVTQLFYLDPLTITNTVSALNI